ncbi:MAG: hypothetical protein M3N95_02260 [Actinomycetota bacterium]|nr:hypothetical protein [Actinomycetota bacterium]
MVNSRNHASQRGASSRPTRQRKSPDGQAAARVATAATAATAATDNAEHIALNLPLVGSVQLPRPEQLAYYAGIGALVALEILDWPAALVLGVGHALLTQQHNRTIHEFGEVLEEALL